MILSRDKAFYRRVLRLCRWGFVLRISLLAAWQVNSYRWVKKVAREELA